MCPKHNRKLEVIWVDHQVRIWTNWALFGDHKSHDIREETEVINEITARTELLIDIYELIEQNRANMEQLKDVDGLYRQFRAKQNAVEKFKEYCEELMRKQREVLHVLENNFESLERDFYEIQRGPKIVLEAAEQWSNLAQQKMEKFNNATSVEPKGNAWEYIAFDMLEDPTNPEDIIKMGEKVLEDLASNSDLPVSRIQDQLLNLTRQIDQNFKSKLLVMLDVLNGIAGESTKNLSIADLEPKRLEPLAPKTNFGGVNIAGTKLSQPISSKPVSNLTAKPAKQVDKNLLEDDNDLLGGSFHIGDHAKEDNLISQSHDEINFLNDIPDTPDDDQVDPSVIGDTDKAYDVISHVLENGLSQLDLSGRKLGDEFFVSMIESIIDFAEGEPLAVQSLNLSGNNITDVGCEKILEFLIIEKDASVSNIKDVNLSKNLIKDKSVDMILALCEENGEIANLDITGNQFKSKLVLNKLKGIKSTRVVL